MDVIQKQRTKENEAKIILETEESDIYISFSQKKIIATISNANNFKITIHVSSDPEDHGKEKTESLESEDICFLTLYLGEWLLQSRVQAVFTLLCSLVSLIPG